MQVKVLFALVEAVIVAGLPEPDPETNVDVKVDSGDSKADSYLQVVETAGQTSLKLVSKVLGEAMGNKCCKVKKAFTYNPVEYIEYNNGATDVPCGGRLAGKNGTCVDGNVVCDIDNMGVGSIDITFNANCAINRTINLNLVPGSSLFDAMLIAQQKDNEFRFTDKVFQGGVYITSIGGLYENVTACLFWLLYDCTGECSRSKTGVSTTYPKKGDIWTYRYQFYNYSAAGDH